MAHIFGDQLRKARREAKETLVTLAKASGHSVSMVSQIERGEKNPPNEDSIHAWLQVLGCENMQDEFRVWALQSVRSLQVRIQGKSKEATSVLTALARKYENDELNDSVWKRIETIVTEESGHK